MGEWVDGGAVPTKVASEMSSGIFLCSFLAAMAPGGLDTHAGKWNSRPDLEVGKVIEGGERGHLGGGKPEARSGQNE